MTERIYSDVDMSAIRRRCYEAGRDGAELYTVRGGLELVRCRDCERFDGVELCAHPGAPETKLYVNENGFCWAGRRKE